MKQRQSTASHRRKSRESSQPLHVVQIQGALLKLETVVALTGKSASSVRRAVAAGAMPAPVKCGPRCTRWPADSLRAWLAAQTEQAAANSQRIAEQAAA